MNSCDINKILLSIVILQAAAFVAIAISPRALDWISDNCLRQACAIRAFYRARRDWKSA